MMPKSWMKGQRARFGKMMKCIFIGKQIKVEEVVDSSESLATRDYSVGGFSSLTGTGDNDNKTNASNIEEAESSLRESGYLNYEEARALLGRLEYQKGNMEAAFRVFEGIDVAAVMPNMKVSLARRCEIYRRHSQSDAAPPMSMHAVTLLLEAILLKAKSLQALGRMEEAALSCQVILDTVESAIPDGLPEKFAKKCKLQETLNKAVELLPELQKLAGCPNQAILSYRRGLLYNWNLELETKSRIEKEFAIFLLYSGYDANPPTLRFQMEGSFIPRNNIEEAILLLLILQRKFTQNRIKWDPSVLDHLSFALSISGDLQSLGAQMEELPPETMERKEKSLTMALCYHGHGKDSTAMNLLRNMLNDRENVNCTEELLLASKVSSGDSYNDNGPPQAVVYANKAINKLQGKCEHLMSTAFCLLGISLSAQSKSIDSQSRRISMQSDSLDALEVAKQLGEGRDSSVIYHLAIENAEQRKLDAALYYAKELLRIEAGSRIRGWILLVRILSAQKRYGDAETILNAALDQTGKWDQAELLRTKAKLHIAQDQMKNAIQAYTHILAVLQVRKKGFGVSEKVMKTSRERDKFLEMETWHDLGNVYTRLLQWRDAEVCLSKSQALFPYSASRWHSIGLLNQAKGLEKEALESFWRALDVDPTYVPSLISMAKALMELSGNQSSASARSFLREAIRLDRTNPLAWYSLGLFYKSEPGASAVDSLECFEAAALLQETAPIEPFRLGLYPSC